MQVIFSNRYIRDLICYFKKALQCLSNIQPLTDYFLNEIQKFELNIHNPLGSKGQMVNTYASLIQKIWATENSFIAPIEFMQCISELCPQVFIYL